MAIPTDTPVTPSLRQTTLDDFLEPLPDSFRLGGAGPFVINLCSSSVSMRVPASIAGCQQGRVYQILRRENAVLRYRIRLGPFATEADADALLAQVRESYPGALTATASADDLRALSALRVSVAMAPTPAPAAIAVPPAAASEARAAGVTPLASDARVPRPPSAPLPLPPHAAAHATRREAQQGFEATHTLRGVTGAEPEAEGALRWYVIQLSLSETPVDPHTVPILDIFSLYRLYSVSGLQDDRVVHALRLGFFSEQIAASAVANYLAEHYHDAVITRVSAAERDRFVNQGVEARKDIGATGTHTDIEITGDRIVRHLKKIGP